MSLLEVINVLSLTVDTWLHLCFAFTPTCRAVPFKPLFVDMFFMGFIIAQYTFFVFIRIALLYYFQVLNCL